MSAIKTTPSLPTREQTEQRLRNYQQKRSFNFLAPPTRALTPSQRSGKAQGHK